MMISNFINPFSLQETPRLFTAIAEWLAVFVYFNIYKRRTHGKLFILQCVLAFLLFAGFQFVAGILPLRFWIPCMIMAVALMYTALYAVLDIKPKDCGVLTTHAFVLAEFAASLYVQLYSWSVYISDYRSVVAAFLTMFVVYALTYNIYYKVERDNIPHDRNLNINTKELLSVLATGVGAFLMSNLSFVVKKTPFSATENMLYVRTLVDFGGMLMLMTQMGRRNEMVAKNENDAINQLFSRQYEQYKLAVDNSEALRKEMHDMKHYVLALKNEGDPEKRAEVLADMEQAIAIQESFMNTGNQVLDVILTTKSLQCQKKNITLNAMVDGDVLSGIHVKDICSLFGNLIDNAIEATQMLENPEERLITLSVRSRNQFIIVECENCSDPSSVRLKKSQTRRIFKSANLPATTKRDNVKHGYGLKSIAQVAEKYGGAMNCSYEDGWFKVKVLLSHKE
ncbi:MAG: GHKL domain-containing protein [Lachnospiraceae bacterium]|nr:GHKL domain-containing protein [Lachnospiraceae bacterium]